MIDEDLKIPRSAALLSSSQPQRSQLCLTFTPYKVDEEGGWASEEAPRILVFQSEFQSDTQPRPITTHLKWGNLKVCSSLCHRSH